MRVWQRCTQGWNSRFQVCTQEVSVASVSAPDTFQKQKDVRSVGS